MEIQVDDVDAIIANHYENIFSKCNCSKPWPCHSYEYLLAIEVKQLRIENDNLRKRMEKLDKKSKSHRKEQENIRRRKQLLNLHLANHELSHENLARRLGFSQSWVSNHLPIAIKEGEMNE